MKNLKPLHLDLVQKLNGDGVKTIPGFGLCIYKMELDLVKLLRVNVRKKLGSDVIYADAAILFERDFFEVVAKDALSDRRQPESLTVCPLMNFPNLMKYAYLQDGKPNQTWLDMVGVIFDLLPSRMETVEQMFDVDFASLQPIERVPTFVAYLRSLAELDEL